MKTGGIYDKHNKYYLRPSTRVCIRVAFKDDLQNGESCRSESICVRLECAFENDPTRLRIS